MLKDEQISSVNRAVVSLGSNIDKEKNLPKAVELLAEMCEILLISSVYETEPVGLVEQPVFWNAAVLIRTDLSAVHFKERVLAEIEESLGRVRHSDKNAPRTIDVDLTLFNREIILLDVDHSIPDPDLRRHAHVALPIAELLPAELHPETGESFTQIAEKLTLLLEQDKRKAPKKLIDIDITSDII